MKRYNLKLKLLVGFFITCLITCCKNIKDNTESSHTSTDSMTNAVFVDYNENGTLSDKNETRPKVGEILKVDIVEISNPSLQAFFSDYLLPIVKQLPMNEFRKIYIMVTGHPSQKVNKRGNKMQVLQMDIHVSFCDYNSVLAKAAYQGKVKITFIEGYAIMLRDIDSAKYITDTSEQYEWIRWQDYYIKDAQINMCDMSAEFYLIGIEGKIRYLGYNDSEDFLKYYLQDYYSGSFDDFISNKLPTAGFIIHAKSEVQ